MLRDPLDILAAQHAHLVRRRRTNAEPGLQPLGHDALYLRAVAALFAGGNRLNAAITIGVDPRLDEGAAREIASPTASASRPSIAFTTARDRSR
jgi:hypothetical protein